MKKGVFIFWTILVVFASGRLAWSFTIAAPDIGPCLKQSVHGSGKVSEDPQQKGTGQILVVSADNIIPAKDPGVSQDPIADPSPCPANILIRLKTKSYPRFSYGDTISFAGNLSKPFNFSDADGRTFDYQGYLAKDNVFYEIKSAQAEKTENSVDSSAASAGSDHSPDFSEQARKTKGELVEPRGSGTGILAGSLYFFRSFFQSIVYWLYIIKRGFVAHLDSALGEPQAGLAAAMVIGTKSALAPDILDDFRLTGLIHIIVLAGYHVAVVAIGLRRSLSFLPRIWGIWAGAIGIFAFCILVGAEATVVRACTMAAIALYADLVRRDYNAFPALAFAGLIMVIQNPLILLHDMSFQLSFSATLGIILLSKPIEKRLAFIPKAFELRRIVTVSIAALFSVSPFILYLMGQFSVIGVIANVLILPFIPATMLVVFLTGATGFVSSYVSQLFGWIAHLLLSYELFIVEHLAKLPFAAIHVGQFSGWWVVGFYVLFAAAYIYLKRKKLQNVPEQFS